MPYIGTQPLTGQFKKLDAISVVNGQAAYTLNYNSAAYKPATANALLVSVNGVIQGAGDAFNISGSTITFTENLVTGDVIDFIIALGDTGSAVTPVDGSVTTAKLGDDSVTEAKLANSLDMQNITLKGGTTDALTIDSSGRTRIHQNNTATVSAPASGSLVLSGIPDWANKITLVTSNLSPATTNGMIRIRVTVGGSAVTTSVYKYTEARWQDATTADIEDNGAGINYIETVNFTSTNNLHDYMLTFYRVSDYIYKFQGSQFNGYFSGYYIAFAGSITTSAAIDGFDIVPATGNFSGGGARAFWE